MLGLGIMEEKRRKLKVLPKPFFWSGNYKKEMVIKDFKINLTSSFNLEFWMILEEKSFLNKGKGT